MSQEESVDMKGREISDLSTMFQSSRRIRYVIILLGLLGGASAIWIEGSVLIAPAPSVVGPPPPDLEAQPVSMQSSSGAAIKGWLVRAPNSKGAVLLLHGIRASRLSMIPRARLLKRLGYSVLMIDFQAHGESTGDYMTFGLLEARDAEAAIDFLRRQAPGEKVAAIGTSLGGAALLLANFSKPLDAMIVESVYSTIETATEARLRVYLGSIGIPLKYPLLWQLILRLGIYPSQLQPVERIRDVHAPIFIIAGTDDLRTTIEESKLFCSRALDPKECWWIEGAAHVDLYDFAKLDYERRIEMFLKLHLN